MLFYIDKSAKFIIREQSRYRLVWDSVMLLLIVFSCFFIPYQLAFRQDTALTGIQYIYLIDVLFLVDIVLNCFTSFRQHGIEVLDQRACLKRYSRTMLPVDLLSSLPLDLLAWMLIGNGQIMGGSLVLILRLLRLLRIVRLFVLFQRWEEFSWSNPALRNALLLCLESRTFTPDSYVAREGARGKGQGARPFISSSRDRSRSSQGRISGVSGGAQTDRSGAHRKLSELILEGVVL